MDIVFKENELTAGDVLLFQQKMAWTVDPKEQWIKSLKNTLYSVTAFHDEEMVAMGRLLGDESIYWYINDVYVLTQYQNRGVGRQIMDRLIAYVKNNSLLGSEVSVCLMCAKGKEGFYEKFGFRSRPHEYEGSGMELEIAIN